MSDELSDDVLKRIREQTMRQLGGDRTVKVEASGDGLRILLGQAFDTGAAADAIRAANHAQTIMRLQARIKDLEDDASAWASFDEKAFFSRVKRLSEALKKYGAHDSTCRWLMPLPTDGHRGPCSCGLEEALANG